MICNTWDCHALEGTHTDGNSSIMENMIKLYTIRFEAKLFCHLVLHLNRVYVNLLQKTLRSSVAITN